MARVRAPGGAGLAVTPGTLTAPKDFLSSLMPIVPTARREFARSDRFVAFFRIYQGTALLLVWGLDVGPDDERELVATLTLARR